MRSGAREDGMAVPRLVQIAVLAALLQWHGRSGGEEPRYRRSARQDAASATPIELRYAQGACGAEEHALAKEKVGVRVCGFGQVTCWVHLLGGAAVASRRIAAAPASAPPATRSLCRGAGRVPVEQRDSRVRCCRLGMASVARV